MTFGCKYIMYYYVVLFLRLCIHTYSGKFRISEIQKKLLNYKMKISNLVYIYKFMWSKLRWLSLNNNCADQIDFAPKGTCDLTLPSELHLISVCAGNWPKLAISFIKYYLLGDKFPSKIPQGLILPENIRFCSLT